MTERLSVRKTYKLYVGGAFPRSESGRSYTVNDAKGNFLANASRASRKDVRDAVVAARKAQSGWASRTPYNRGQILYRVAEMLEGRRDQFVDDLRATGLTRAAAGDVSLGDTAAPTEPATVGEPMIDTGCRTFSHDTLRDF